MLEGGKTMNYSKVEENKIKTPSSDKKDKVNQDSIIVTQIKGEHLPNFPLLMQVEYR